MGSDGFTWSGTLDETDIQSLYAACQSLRFSGKLELRDGATKADVTFLGGEPIEIDGGDTQRIALWNRGTFRAVQSIPNLAGELTGQREMEGSLAITKASQLWAWVSEYRLTCDIDLERPGSKAVVSFSNGHAESAQVNGMPELAALARVSAWTDGTFRVRLKPLFVDGVIPAAPPMPEGAPPAGRQFDVSRSIPMDLKIREQQRVQGASFGPPRPATPVPTTPPPMPAGTPPLGALAMMGQPQATGRGDDRTSETRPLPPLGQRRNPFDPIEASQPHARHDPTELVRGRSKLPWVLSLGGIALAGGLGALYSYHLPPFSPPPKPIEKQLAADSQTPTAPEQKKPEASGAAVTPSGAAVTPSGEAAAPSGAAVTPSGEAAAPSGEAAAPSGEAAAPSGEPVKPAEAKKPPRTREKEAKKEPRPKPWDKYVARGRALLIEGHKHGALDLFRRAQRMAPRDATLRVYELQALGKLGHAELLLEGRGVAVVDGHKFTAPRKLRVMAGPHVIDAGDGDDEVTLKRGEKKKIRIKK